jgi:hypothetical protein
MTMTQVHAQERKIFASTQRACRGSVSGSNPYGISLGASGTATEQQSTVGTLCGSMTWSDAAPECAPLKNSTVLRLQCSTMVAPVDARQVQTLVQIAKELQTGASNPESIGIQAIRARIRRSGARTPNGARTCRSAVLECATLQPMKLVLAC